MNKHRLFLDIDTIQGVPITSICRFNDCPIWLWIRETINKETNYRKDIDVNSVLDHYLGLSSIHYASNWSTIFQEVYGRREPMIEEYVNIGSQKILAVYSDLLYLRNGIVRPNGYSVVTTAKKFLGRDFLPILTLGARQFLTRVEREILSGSLVDEHPENIILG